MYWGWGAGGDTDAVWLSSICLPPTVMVRMPGSGLFDSCIQASTAQPYVLNLYNEPVFQTPTAEPWTL